MDFTDQQIYRYSRHIILPEVGGKGQKRILESHLLLVGLGAAGSAAALYLAAAGVGRIGIADGSTVSLADLQSQIIHSTKDLNAAKTRSAKPKMLELNPDVKVNILSDPLAADRREELFKEYKVILDATEDGPSHFSLNETCVALSLPLVVADVDGFNASIQTVIPGQGPCYRCLHAQAPEPSGQGLLGPLGGAVGALLATEAIKLILGKGVPLCNRVLNVDLRATKFSLLPVSRNPDCPVCGHIAPNG